MLEEDCDLKKLYYFNRSLHNPWYSIYLVFYMLLPISSIIANGMLLIAIYTFGRNRLRQRNQPLNRNLFVRPLKPEEIIRDRLICHLAVLDILLSLTVPLTALHVLPKFWPLGKNTEVFCQFTKASPTAVVYSSSMLIILIAVNCYRQIVIPHKKQFLPNDLKYIATGIAILSIVLSIPHFYHTKLLQLHENDTNVPGNETSVRELLFGTTIGPFSSNASLAVISEQGQGRKRQIDTCEHYNSNGWSHVVFCIEEWPFGEDSLDPKSRLPYSVFVFATQLLIPLIIISCCYYSVYSRLRSHYEARRLIVNLRREEMIQKQNRRSNRRNKHMAMISIGYLMLWLPLGISSLLLDFNPDILGRNMTTVTMVVSTCHLIAMCSAVANPIIYGYTNKHIRKGRC